MATRRPTRRARDRHTLLATQLQPSIDANPVNITVLAGVISLQLDQPVAGTGNLPTTILKADGAGSIDAATLDLIPSGSSFEAAWSLGTDITFFLAAGASNYKTASGGGISRILAGPLIAPA
jgi:hypothetical protein